MHGLRVQDSSPHHQHPLQRRSLGERKGVLRIEKGAEFSCRRCINHGVSHYPQGAVFSGKKLSFCTGALSGALFLTDAILNYTENPRVEKNQHWFSALPPSPSFSFFLSQS
jgi:hypothetical protein